MAKSGKGESEKKKVSAPLWSSTFIIIVALAFIASVNGNGMQNGIVVLIDSQGGAAYLSGYISGFFSFAALAARLISGNLSDIHGRKKICVIGALVQVLGCAWCMLVTDVRWLLVARTFTGLGFGAFLTVSAAAIADIVPKSRMGEGIGYHGLAFALSMALGPSLAIIVVNDLGGPGLFISFTILTGIAFLMSVLCPFRPSKKLVAFQEGHPELDELDIDEIEVKRNGRGKAEREAAKLAEREAHPSHRNPIKRFFANYLEKKAVPTMVVSIFNSIAWAIYMNFTSLYAQENGIPGISFFFTTAAIVMLFLRFAGAKLIDRFPINALLMPSFIAGALGCITLLLIKSSTGLIIAGAFYGISCAMPQPGLVSEALRRSPEDRRGAASATFYIGCDIGVGVGTIIWGYVIEALGFQVAFIGGALTFGIAIVLSLILLKSKSKVR